MYINSFCAILFTTKFTKVISHVFLRVQKTEIARVLAIHENYRLHEISMD